MIDHRRILFYRKNSKHKGPIVYWMSRCLRIEDNWAFLYSLDVATNKKIPLFVFIFNPIVLYNSLNIKQVELILKTSVEIQDFFNNNNIESYYFDASNYNLLFSYIQEINPSLLVTDFFPLNEIKELYENLFSKIKSNVSIVDSFNIVPTFWISNKQEYNAATLRRKINRYLHEFLIKFPEIRFGNKRIDFSESRGNTCLIGATTFAKQKAKEFIETKLNLYAEKKNDPVAEVVSGLSPFINAGILSAQWLALEVSRSNTLDISRQVFLEELIVRRELAENFCHFNSNYKNFNGFPEWARKTLEKHEIDEREYIYNLNQFENALTHDILWNSAQKKLVKTGKMHGYIRMYWAKKILEWSKSPQEAINIAIYLNDKYALDGFSPNGYTGIAWSIGGVHDRPWKERQVFGKIRYMNYEGCKRKFNVLKYINN